MRLTNIDSFFVLQDHKKPITKPRQEKTCKGLSVFDLKLLCVLSVNLKQTSIVPTNYFVFTATTSKGQK